jgi:hypothetical protein
VAASQPADDPHYHSGTDFFIHNEIISGVRRVTMRVLRIFGPKREEVTGERKIK